MKKEILKRILGYGIPIAIIVYISIPSKIGGHSSGDIRKGIIISQMFCLRDLFIAFDYDNKRIPKNLKELYEYAKKINNQICLEHFDDARTIEYFGHPIKVIQIDETQLPPEKLGFWDNLFFNDKYFFSIERVGYDVSIVYVLTKDKGFKIYATNSKGKFLAYENNKMFFLTP